jgi:hypothetical protein
VEEDAVRTMSLAVAVMAAFAVAVLGGGPGRAQESMTIVEGVPWGPDAASAGRSPQAPPWHGSVGAVDCGPHCPPGNVYHADPRGQLFTKCQVLHGRHGCVTLPPCFPRLHTLFAEGYLPTPRPITLPRCHQCGAVIEGGF